MTPAGLQALAQSQPAAPALVHIRVRLDSARPYCGNVRAHGKRIDGLTEYLSFAITPGFYRLEYTERRFLLIDTRDNTTPVFEIDRSLIREIEIESVSSLYSQL